MKDFLPDGADEVLDLFQKLLEHRLKNAPKDDREQQAAELASELNLQKLYLFPRMEPLLKASRILQNIYHGDNRLYKNPETGQLCLVVSKSAHTPEEFNKVCNILSEYGSNGKYSPSNEAYMTEHYTLLLGQNALDSLSRI